MRFLYTSVPPSTKTKKVCRIVHTFFHFVSSAGQPVSSKPRISASRQNRLPCAQKSQMLTLEHPPFLSAAEQRYNTLDFAGAKSCAKGGPSRPPLETSHIPTTSFRGPKPEKPSSGSFSPEEKQRFTVPGENGKNDRRIDHANASVKIKRAAHMAQPGKREVAERTAISLYRPFR